MAAYLEECELRFLSPRTIETRQGFIRNLFWFLEKRGYAVCGTSELRQFFRYLLHGHEDAGGRFGQKQLNQPVKPITLKDYDVCLRAFFAWIKSIGAIEETPFCGIPKPRVREGIKASLSSEQIAALMAKARETAHPKRDVAILAFLLDTGCRASELIFLRIYDVDFADRCARVLGKGNKYRTLYFGERTAQVLQEYLDESQTMRASLQKASKVTAEPTLTEQKHTGPMFMEQMPLFLSERNRAGKEARALTRSGLLQLLERLGKQCGIKASCSPHTLRRTFAVQTLRNGANVFSVQAMLGHTDLQMTQKYCALALADVEAQHRQFGPLDRLGFHASGPPGTMKVA